MAHVFGRAVEDGTGTVKKQKPLVLFDSEGFLWCPSGTFLGNKCHFIEYLLSAVLSNYATAHPYSSPAW